MPPRSRSDRETHVKPIVHSRSLPPVDAIAEPILRLSRERPRTPNLRR